jgi:16S rRNA (guanine527-N7)-methyltransferase
VTRPAGPVAVLAPLLEEARDRGFLGPRPVADQLRHAVAFAAIVGPPGGRFVDLGSGAGLPGLVVALMHPDAPGVLLDASERRAGWLAEACDRLAIAERIEVVPARAEDAARDPDLRGRATLVTARSFAAPAPTAECAVGFLARGGRLAVSEPPTPDPTRWPRVPLAELGLEAPEIHHRDDTTVALLRATTPPKDRYPRRAGIPEKRPLWRSST